jgi:hypothetical protein
MASEGEGPGQSSPPSWASTIPELFYDVLARFLPGFVALAVFANGYIALRLWLAVGGPQMSTLEAMPASLLVPSIFIGCWATGLLLTYLGEWLNGGFRLREANKRLNSAEGAIVLNELKDIKQGDLLGTALNPGKDGQFDSDQVAAIYQLLHEYLKARSPEWRSVLTKNQAEVAFFENVTAAMLIFGVVAILVSLFLLLAQKENCLYVTSWNLIGCIATVAIPCAAVFGLSFLGMKKKCRRLWRRHLGMFQTDMLAREEQAKKGNTILSAVDTAK